MKKYNKKNLTDFDEKELPAVIIIIQKEIDATKDPIRKEKLKRILESLVKKND